MLEKLQSRAHWGGSHIWGERGIYLFGSEARGDAGPIMWFPLRRRLRCAKEGCSMTPEEWQRNEANRWLSLAARDVQAASSMGGRAIYALPQPSLAIPSEAANLTD